MKDDRGRGGNVAFLLTALQIPDDDFPIGASPGSGDSVRRHVQGAESEEAEFSSPQLQRYMHLDGRELAGAQDLAD